MWICSTCAVEHSERPEVCAICADERQWVPKDGQHWTSLDELSAAGTSIDVRELEPDLYAVTSSPGVGIGQTSKLVRTPAGNLLWDPIGYVDADGAAKVRELGEVVAIAASHPHMFGVQVEWSRALGGVPVLVAEPDLEWVARPDPVIQPWKQPFELAPGLTLTQPGGHFPGSAVVHWAAGAEDRGVLLSGDTIFPNPGGQSASFMRSFPNRIPLSAAVVDRVTKAVEVFEFDRVYGNFDNSIDTDAKQILRFSADRHMAWVRGDHDHLT